MNQYIRNKNVLDFWTMEEEVKVQTNGKQFKKVSHSFAKLGVLNKTEFTIIRFYPGGGR